MPRKGSRCLQVFARQEVCHVRLARGRYHHSKDLGITARDEIAIGEYDARGRLISIQLLGDAKPCQNSIAFVGEQDEHGKMTYRRPTRAEIRERAAWKKKRRNVLQ